MPPEQRHAAGLNIFNLYPAANVGDANTSNTFLSAPIITQSVPSFAGRVDHALSSSHNLSGHYALSWGHKENPFDPLAPYTQLPGYGTTVITHGQNGGASWNRIFNSRTLNELHVGFNGEHGIFTQADKTDHNTRLGFPTVLTAPIDLGFPNVSVAGFDGIGQPTNTPQDLYQNSYGGYFQDDFRVTDRLTLNLGLRYEYNVPVTEGHNQLSVPDLRPASAACTPKPGCLFIPAGTGGIPPATYLPDRNSFASRVGFASRPLRSEHFVVRSGYGIYYDQTLLNAHLGAL